MRNLNNISNAFNKTMMSRGKNTISIVNSRNGKRMAISHSLSSELGLEKIMDVILDIDAHEILLSKSFPYNGASQFTISGNKNKISYKARLVDSITESMGLDFSSSTSKTFADIAFETDEETGVKYAVVKIPKDTGVSEDEANNEDQQNKAV